MMSEDMSDMISKISSMLNSDTLPDGLKDMLGNLKNSSSESTSKEGSSSNSTSSSPSSTEQPAIDFETILKMQSIIGKLNTKDDPRSNLLLSLKPYLKPSRRDKVEQYIKLFNMSKVMEVFKPDGGDKTNDVH